MTQKKVVVLGGGISGLAAAWRLAKRAPKDKLHVTLLEASPRAGGWLKTKPVPGVGIFECGPRSLRPAGLPGLSTLGLIDQIGLTDKIYAVDRQEPASKIRSIYYNGELHQLPTKLSGILTNKSPILEGLIPGLLKEPFVRSKLGVEEDEIYS
ncbi:hypothetical protein DSO57_1009996 [Entomophthora muscae]|uniref:Uncharacterized protein n=1 Tax=Entomophthora muscae TaxID=34485 RepID=A0ACC2RLG7_9FUNG|nr:hypothetical protein DSO57_1009996 [Entomophthora muscae]